jgi:hypothetical protein
LVTVRGPKKAVAKALEALDGVDGIEPQDTARSHKEADLRTGGGGSGGGSQPKGGLGSPRLQSGQRENETVRYRLRGSLTAEDREQIAEMILKSGWALQELSSEGASLEQVFAHLTSEDQASSSNETEREQAEQGGKKQKRPSGKGGHMG